MSSAAAAPASGTAAATPRSSTTVDAATAGTAGGPAARAARRGAALLGLVPFAVFISLFLFVPTAVVAVGAFVDVEGRPSLGALGALQEPFVVDAFVRTIVLSAVTALIGAVVGGLVAYAVSTAREGGFLRRAVTSAAGVLAQFGGVMLAFAFVATLGLQGLVTVRLRDLGVDIYSGGVWLFDLSGLVLVYCYFQVPLMVLVFLPAVEALRPQWREAAEGLGGSTWQFWRYVGGPVLAPSFLGCTLLLFANAFSSYATAASLVSQGNPIVPLQIRGALTSEVILNQQNLAKALALGMIVVVAVVMVAYAVLQRRTSRWLG